MFGGIENNENKMPMWQKLIVTFAISLVAIMLL